LIDNGTTAVLCPFDNDILTSPSIPTTCQPFGGYEGVTADDCKEGYFEAIGMSAISQYVSWGNPILNTELDCRNYDGTSDLGNVLSGDISFFELSSLATYSYEATAIADTRLSPLNSTAGIDAGGIPVSMDKGCAEADYIFTKSNIRSSFNLIPDIGGKTEIIVTFPTRVACHSTSLGKTFNVDLTVWSEAFKITFACFDHCGFFMFPNVVNLLAIGAVPPDIWSSSVSVPLDVLPFRSGWFDLDLYFGNPDHLITYGLSPSRTAYGEPVVVYTTQSFLNGSSSYVVPASCQTKIE
jgi:hypothetical protein